MANITMGNTIQVDYSNLEQLKGLMANHENFPEMLFGKNTNGEDTITSINADNIVLTTHQNNHWVRVNTFWYDGTIEETFDGRW